MTTTPAELVRLDIPAQPAFVGVARTVVAAVATSVTGIDDDRLEDLRIAVSEACTNAVESHGDESTHRVVLRCLLEDARLEIRLEDSGTGLAQESMGEPPDAERPEEHLEGEPGWGLQLIRALVDDLHFDRSSGGTALHLYMRRSGADAAT
jgi:serine/threonine-protein kinase RsbW